MVQILMCGLIFGSNFAEVFLDLSVNDLMVQNHKEWDVPLLHSLFPTEDASNIMKVPLFRETATDKRIWVFSKHGSYPVKSGYRFYMDRFSSLSQHQVDGDWFALWKLHVPPKVKVFLWRCCCDTLPTIMRLQSKGILCPIVCVYYENDLENTCHCFFTCPFSQRCWQELHLWNIIEAHVLHGENFMDVFFYLYSCISES